MLVRVRLHLIAAAACVFGCGPGVREPDGPPALVRAGLSDRWPWMGVYTVVQWDFHDDGTATATTFFQGGGGGSWDRAILRINAELCATSDEEQPVDLVYFNDGQEKPSGAPGLVRGKVCLEETAPCQSGLECDGCRTMWCDGEPPEPYPCDG
jgi:hypothetical protein